MISEGYSDARTLARRVSKMEKWLESPTLMEAWRPGRPKYLKLRPRVLKLNISLVSRIYIYVYVYVYIYIYKC